MYYAPYMYHYPHPYNINVPIYNYGRAPVQWMTPQQVQQGNWFNYRQVSNLEERIVLKDYGNNPLVVDIEEATKQNNTFRTALWTGKHLQVVVMSLNVGEDIGAEVHPTVDQFIRIEDGDGIIKIGDTKENLNFTHRVNDDFAIMIPAGKWHNLINTGDKPLKLYTIYAPPEHPFGTIHNTKADALAAERY